MSVSHSNYHANKEKTKSETVKVCIRVRPLLQHEDVEFWTTDENSNTIATINSYQGNRMNDKSESVSIWSHKEKDLKKVLMDSIYSPQNFAFDKIYPQTTNSQLIYKEVCRKITKSVLSGYNGSIFMYGQTTSGKTFTMLGTPNSPGVLPCALRDIFNMIQKEKFPESYNVYCSYIEIYNENIHDLLTDSNFLKLVDDSKYGVIVSGAKRVKIKSFEDGITLKDFGEENRKYRETLINEYSSRSHTIFQIFIETDYSQEGDDDNISGNRFSCLNLVDLAGSERLNDYETKTEGFGETGYINKSLFVLANVINKLAEGKNTHIPYRDSKLTRLLSQALGGNSLTVIICTISPAALNYYQTLSTLRFGNRAKFVKIKAVVNEYMDDKGALEYYKNEVKKLQDELRNRTIQNNTANNDNQMNNNYGLNDPNQREILEQIVKTNESLSNELENYKELYLNEKEKNEEFKNELEKIKTSFMMTPNNAGEKDRFSDNNKMKINADYSSTNKGYPKGKYQYQDDYNKDTQKKKNISTDQGDSDDHATKLTQLILRISEYYGPSHKSYHYWIEEASKINNEYKTEIASLHNSYVDKIKELCSTIFAENTTTPSQIPSYQHPTSTYETLEKAHHYLKNTPDLLNEESDDIIVKINTGQIFNDIRFNFNPDISNSLENNIRVLKQSYEDKVDSLEKTMDYYKSYIENYYRRKIQQTRNTHMDSVEMLGENLPIMKITSEHNEKLKLLRELYDGKLQELETTFFEFLRLITASKKGKFEDK